MLAGPACLCGSKGCWRESPGHSKPGARMAVAAEHAGVNSNVLTDPSIIDPLSGNAVLNGIPVEVVPA